MFLSFFHKRKYDTGHDKLCLSMFEECKRILQTKQLKHCEHVMRKINQIKYSNTNEEYKPLMKDQHFAFQ